MSFTIRNKTIAAIELKDLGLTLAASADLSLLSEDPSDIQSSADLLASIAATDIVVLDPLDGVELSMANSTAAVTNANDPHYALNEGDIRISTEATGISFKNLRAANTRQWVSGPIDSISITDGGAGTIDVAAGEGFFHTSSTETSPIELASWPAVTALALTDNLTQIVYADYNAGSPIVAVTTDLTVDGSGVVNGLDKIVLGYVDRDGTTVVIYEAVTVNNISDKIVQRLVDAEGLTHTQGVGTLILDLGSQKIGLTAGSFWLGLLKIPHASFDTSAADTFQYWRRDGAGGWIEEAAAETDWDNLQFDGDPGLVTLTDKRYTNVWVYLEMGNPASELHVIYGTSNEKTVQEALGESIPGIGSSLPPPLQRLGIFVGRFVVKKSDTSSTVVDSPFEDPSGGGGGTQNLWESIASDSGATTADSPLDTLTISGGSALNTAISGDIVTVAVDNDAIFPGDGSVTVPVGTTGERPGAPTTGMLRFNETTGLMEYYNGTEWINLSGTSTGPGTVKGNILGYHFLLDKDIYNSWLGTTTRHINSDEVQYVMPFNGEITALTYGSFIAGGAGGDVDAFIEFANFGSGANNHTLFYWKISSARVAHNSALGEVFTIDFTGITGATLPTGVTPGASFDVYASSQVTPFPGALFRFWFDDTTTTPPPTGTSIVVAIPFTAGDTDQDISDAVVTAMLAADADFAATDNAAGTTPLVSCTLVGPGNVRDVEDGTPGVQRVDVGSARTLLSATGLADNATVYTATVSVDGGGAQALTVTGSLAQTYYGLLLQLNLDTAGADWVLFGGDIYAVSDSNGTGSTISISDTDIFSSLTDFVAVDAAVAGSPLTGAAFTTVTDGGPFGLQVTKGGKMGVFCKDPGGGTEPEEVVLSVFIQWLDEPQEEAVEDYAGVFNANPFTP
jgi:hypothetical protein